MQKNIREEKEEQKQRQEEALRCCLQRLHHSPHLLRPGCLRQERMVSLSSEPPLWR